VQKNSESSLRCCQVLLLLEALKQQRPDLRPVPLRTLISLPGLAGKRLRPSASVTRRAVANVFGTGDIDDLDIVAEGLRIAPTERALPGDDGDVSPSTILRRFQTEPFRLLEVPRFGPTRTAGDPVEPPIMPEKRPSRVRGALEGLLRVATTEGVREDACTVVAPFLIRFIATGNPRLRVAAMVAAAGCGFELTE